MLLGNHSPESTHGPWVGSQGQSNSTPGLWISPQTSSRLSPLWIGSTPACGSAHRPAQDSAHKEVKPTAGEEEEEEKEAEGKGKKKKKKKKGKEGRRGRRGGKEGKEERRSGRRRQRWCKHDGDHFTDPRRPSTDFKKSMKKPGEKKKKKKKKRKKEKKRRERRRRRRGRGKEEEKEGDRVSAMARTDRRREERGLTRVAGGGSGPESMAPVARRWVR